jgi:hypothetical protein
VSGLTLQLPEFAARLREHTGGQRPVDPAAEDAVVRAALDGRCRPVVQAPWPETPPMGWVGEALQRLVSIGEVSTLTCQDRKLWLLKATPSHQIGDTPDSGG